MANTTPPPPAMESVDQFVQWVLENTQVKGPKIVDWLYTEVPEVVEQFLAWNLVQSLIIFLVCVFGIFGYPFVFYKVARFFYNKLEEDCKDNPAFWLPMGVLALGTGMASQINGWLNINIDWIKIWLAPKVYLLETFVNTVK
jgi:hypothetical protein